MGFVMDQAYRQALTDGMRAGGRYALAVPRNVPSGLAGLQLGRNAGASLEFRDHRAYQPGDDLRFIDWAAYARSDKITVKVYREEVNPHVDLLIDGSRSMALTDTAKARATLGVASAIVTAGLNTGYSHNAYVTRDGCEPIPSATQPPNAWDGIAFDSPDPLDRAVLQTPPNWRGQGIRVLLSDLLFMADPVLVLEHIAHHAAAVYVVQVLADADVNPPQRGNVKLVDCETGAVREVFVDAGAEKRYRENLARHQQAWSAACRRVGAVMVTIVAERVVENWDLGDLASSHMLEIA